MDVYLAELSLYGSVMPLRTSMLNLSPSHLHIRENGHMYMCEKVFVQHPNGVGFYGSEGPLPSSPAV